LRIPSSYLPTGPDDSERTYNDGRLGTALIQEYRFNEYCKRLQRLICETFDREFKIFLKYRGLELDNSAFELRLNQPQNFSKYRETEIDTARISTFNQLEQFPYMSKRFLMQRFLGLTEEEMQENEKLWAEENTEDITSDMPSLRSVGVTGGDIQNDLDTFDVGADTEEPEAGVETEAPAPEAGGEVPTPPPTV